MRVETAFSIARDALWASANGYGYTTFHVDCSSIERARNRAVMVAIHQGFDFLVMQDSDCFVLPSQPGSLLGQCMAPLKDHKAAACGAVFLCRGVDKMNANPAEPNTIYEGEVGTGFIVIDMKRLGSMPMPWFVQHHDEETHTETTLGEDVDFCRRVKAHGEKVIVNYAVATGHACEATLRCQPAEIVEGAEDVLRIGDKRFAVVGA